MAVSGAAVSTQVEHALFESCSSDSAGGAISASGSSSLSLLGCAVEGSTAWGIGGGAVHLDRCDFAAYNTSVSNSRAPRGGGGAVLWQGWIGSAAIQCPIGMGSVGASCASVLADAAACQVGTCELCTAGTFQDSRGGPWTCQACNAGTFSSIQGASACSSCAAGTYSSVQELTGCFLCGAGTYSDVPGSSACISCAAGTHASVRGANTSFACVDCPAGTYSSFEGANSSSECLLCGAGTYSDVPGSSACVSCSESDGQISAQNSSAACIHGVRSGAPRISNQSKVVQGVRDQNSVFPLSPCSFERPYNVSNDDFKFEKRTRLPSMLILQTNASRAKEEVQAVLKGRRQADHNRKIKRETALGHPSRSHIALKASTRRPHGTNREWRQAALDGGRGRLLADNNLAVRALRLRATGTTSISNAISTTVSESSVLDSLCVANNSAAYGDCKATDYWELQVPEGTPSWDRPAYPGIVFSVTVYKKDAYNHTILSDSSSLLQIRTSSNGSTETDVSVAVLGSTVVQLEQGAVVFSVQLKPSYSVVVCASGVTVLQSDPFIYFAGQDADGGSTVMLSPSLPVALSGGFGICPRGYVLVFDSPNLRKGPAQCQWCSAGTYSVLPLASRGGLSDSSDPECLNCPAGGNCVQGGDGITFALGEWRLEWDQYRLVNCPPGTQLINSTDGSSKGTYSHDAQQCKPCLPTEYIVDPNTDVCQTCPPGLVCSGTNAVTAKMNGSTWVRNGSVYRLLSCPAGYSVSSAGASGTFDATAQQCSPCPKGQECVSAPCVACSRCQPNFYKPTETDDACSPCPADTYGTLQGAQDLSACQPCPQGAFCSDGSGLCALRDPPFLSCPSGQRIVGSWVLDNSSGRYSLVGCPAGYLENADQCQECPASFYCADGLSTPCASGHFSLPGSSNATSCFPSVFVVVVINVPIPRPFFDQTAAFQNALAVYAAVDPAHITISVVQAGSDVATTDITSEIATPDASAADALSKSLTRDSGAADRAFASVGSELGGSSLVSVQVTACVVGYELEEQPPPSSCQLCLANYYCAGGTSGRVPCPDGGFSSAGANASSACMQFAVSILVGLPISPSNFTLMLQSAFVTAVASAAGVSPQRVSVLSIGESTGRRAVLPALQVTAQISADSETDAVSLSAQVDLSTLNRNLAAAGLPLSTSVAVSAKSASAAPAALGVSNAVIAGVSAGAFCFLVFVSAAGYYFGGMILKQRAHKSFVAAFSKARNGDAASPHTLPPDLRRLYSAERIVGRGAFGCVVQAKKLGSNQAVAIKIMMPEKGVFDGKEIRRLRREASVHELFMTKRCEHAVHLAANTGAVEIRAEVAWLVLEYLDGEDMDCVVHPRAFLDPDRTSDSAKGDQPVSDMECITVARGVLAALKVMHAEGIVHRDIKPANIVRCWHQGDGQAVCLTKLIDFGSALGVDETVAKAAMMTLVGNRGLAEGTPPYMSPEMFKEPEKASYPTDVWSLGVTMFELVTATLPFCSESDLLWSFAIAGNMDEKAPEVLDMLPEGRRSTFDHNLSKVIAKSLEKRVEARYGSADEMHEAAFACLIQRGEACYSAFISYRVASEAPLARLLFDELNHSVTAGGHRVTVYWDAHRLVKGEDWEEGFASGLLHSLVFLPLLSYGFTAPLAALPEERLAQAAAQGWEAAPLGRRRLAGAETDPEDNCLKELLIANFLLRQRKAGAGACGGGEEPARLRLAYPILVGRQQPEGHSGYPCMGSFFAVQGGGGRFPDRISPPTARAVGAFLRDKAGFSAEGAGMAESVSVQEAVTAMTRLQGCQLWNHAKVCRWLQISLPHLGLLTDHSV